MKKKKNIRRVLSLVIIAACCGLIFMQLKSNKEETKKIAELANIKGQYYPVKALIIEPTNPNAKITTTGFLQSETDLNLISETQGRIIAVYKEKGDYVNKGDIIAKVDDELLRAQLNATKAAYEQLEKEVARFTKLVEENAVTSQKLEEIQLNLETTKAKYVSAKKQLEDTNIKAPINGFIESDNIEVGQFIGGGAVICNIIDAKNLTLKLDISEQDYANIKLGQTVDITSSVFPNQTFRGTISYIGKKAGYGNSFSAEIKLANTNDNLLKAGMFVTASISLQSETTGIFVPRRAIVGSLKDASVYVINDNKSILKKVITGNTIDGQVQIVEGLKDGDSVIVEGNYNIYDQADVKVMNL
ncbi:efflux RND transporter periplasmic adaptor subunit [Plebeiibacterium marinum]|uniref:Efflux RND transporter periplasmic adaptor subunit n=1 Tax=Plebeiibacterium marinum TaxID=2992111 RepID=A0AAE3MB08_9BACT|nr:efflux RND transporter periplasmic adaptor subunit [Plebeiobacterium marinum]MCW3804531.1 efflux RND transporter periplasmic adaptor subunit [Plebeiobacterium marinum]